MACGFLLHYIEHPGKDPPGIQQTARAAVGSFSKASENAKKSTNAWVALASGQGMWESEMFRWIHCDVKRVFSVDIPETRATSEVIKTTFMRGA